MSEPLSLAFHAPIDLAAFARAARLPLTPPAAFDDWDALGYVTDADTLAQAQAATPASAASYLRNLRDGAVKDRGWYLRHDPASGYLTGMSLLWPASWPEIIAGYAVLRQLLVAAGTGGDGYVLRYGFIFPGTAGAILLGGGQSAALADDDPRTLASRAHAAPHAAALRVAADRAFNAEEAGLPASQGLTDQLDALLAG